MNYGGTARQQPKPSQQTGVVNAASASGGADSGVGSSRREQHAPDGENAPPTYADAVKGDHKVQTDD